MNAETNDRPDAAAPADRRHDTGEEPLGRNSGNGAHWYNRYIEVVIGGSITAFLIGGGAWIVSHFATEIDKLEKTIAAHHGPEWAQINKIMAVSNLHSELLGAKHEYETRLTSLATELNSKQERCEKSLEALTKWTGNADNLVIKRLKMRYEAYAQLTDRAPKDKDVAMLNVANSNGTRFQVGDKVEVVNMTSGLGETTTLEISGAYTDLDHTDVLLQLAQQPATTLGLTRSLGNIKISAKKQDLPRNDPNRWKSISELIKEQQP